LRKQFAVTFLVIERLSTQAYLLDIILSNIFFRFFVCVEMRIPLYMRISIRFLMWAIR